MTTSRDYSHITAENNEEMDEVNPLDPSLFDDDIDEDPLLLDDDDEDEDTDEDEEDDY